MFLDNSHVCMMIRDSACLCLPVLTYTSSAFFAYFARFNPWRGRAQLQLILGHLSHFLQKCLLQRLRHQHYVICRLQKRKVGQYD